MGVVAGSCQVCVRQRHQTSGLEMAAYVCLYASPSLSLYLSVCDRPLFLFSACPVVAAFTCTLIQWIWAQLHQQGQHTAVTLLWVRVDRVVVGCASASRAADAAQFMCCWGACLWLTGSLSTSNILELVNVMNELTGLTAESMCNTQHMPNTRAVGSPNPR